MVIVVVACVILAPLLVCTSQPPPPRRTLAPADVARWLNGVQALEVRTANGTLLSRVTDPSRMRAFVSLLPLSEFDDILSESGQLKYFVWFVGPGRTDYSVAFSDTHVRYVPKGAAKLGPGERARILAELGVAVP